MGPEILEGNAVCWVFVLSLAGRREKKEKCPAWGDTRGKQQHETDIFKNSGQALN